MFWARTDCLNNYLNLPIHWLDFPEEPIPTDGTLAHALERLFFIFAYEHKGQYIKLQKYDSIQDFRFYEEQRDYSKSITYDDIKILSYYLPQFHPIPENDLWHGKGFTEWTKVKSANPLFAGHYQQHIPHPDIGYYLLDSPDILKKQAAMMQKAGIYGQIFYHYWFSGKLILEEPVQMLLHNSNIQMPFCFCWANENWTKRWDGNENEVLLAQNYSVDDASNFIKYLIPFFKDHRYIKIDNRPVLFVYRPASIPNPIEYQNIWKEECEANGVNAPYVVATITRGAKHPNDFEMDAGVERVLHDWTNGNVAEIQDKLNPYWTFSGSILPYNEVADYYIQQTDQKDFTYFRSLIPIWDNTARYYSEAYLVHQSTPELFQNWLEHTIQYTKRTLPNDKRFIVINAWNEWAEGAHLEPDTRFGYSYLNAIGRSLSNLSFNSNQKPVITISNDISIFIDIPAFIKKALESDSYLKKRFVWHLARSTIFRKCKVYLNEPSLLNDYKDSLNFVESGRENAQFILQFRRIALVIPECIENMLQTAIYYPNTVVLTNNYDSSLETIKVENNSSVNPLLAYTNALLLLPNTNSLNTCFKIRTDARAFVTDYVKLYYSGLPRVTTIIRFHKSANFNELRNALYCLAAMHSCVVTPFIAAQDLSNEQQATLEELLKEFSYIPDQFPRVEYFYSKDGCGDLRAKMLNECIKKVKTRYASFLDYDDFLMPHAFNYLINRLRNTSKAIAFGRVFATNYNSETELFIERRRTYEYGYSYDEFIKLNHAPIHSFMLDLMRLDLSKVKYFEYQHFMEDYYFTLQVFTKDNVDWIGLADNVYIGDYIHCVNRTHTLAITNEQQRFELTKSKDYLICEDRIHELRMNLYTQEM